MNDYEITLMAPDGTVMGRAASPVLPRFLHIGDDLLTGSDDPEPPAEMQAKHVETFARIGGAVWVDDDRCALFVRVVA